MSSNETMTPAEEPREHSIGRYIGALDRMARMYIDLRLAPFGIGFSQFQILLVLYEGDGISQHEIGCRLRIDKSVLARTIPRLVEEGYVERLADPTDERAYRVVLTERARREEPAIKAILRSWTTNMTHGLTAEEFSLLDGLLLRMFGNAEQMLKEARAEACAAARASGKTPSCTAAKEASCAASKETAG